MTLLVVLSAFYGINKKIADLLNEHGLKLFKGANMLFGGLWGGSGILLCYWYPPLASLLFAQIVAYVIRLRLDYSNHALAGGLILFYIGAFESIDNFVLAISMLFFIIGGTLRDFEDQLKNKWIKLLLDLSIYHYLLGIILWCLTTDFTYLICLATDAFFYSITKYYAASLGYK